MKKLIVCVAATALAAAALSVAYAAQTHSITLFQESYIGDKALKPGDYRLTLDGDKVTIGKGKDKVEASITVQSADSKFGTTSVRYSNGDGKYRVKEIRLGGTATKLVFN